MSAYADDSRVRRCGTGFEVRAELAGATRCGCVEPAGDGMWESYWVGGEPMPQTRSSDEAIRQLVGAPQ